MRDQLARRRVFHAESMGVGKFSRMQNLLAIKKMCILTTAFMQDAYSFSI